MKIRVEISYDVTVPDTLQDCHKVITNLISEGLVEPDDVNVQDDEEYALESLQEFIAYAFVEMSHGGDETEAVTQVNDQAWRVDDEPHQSNQSNQSNQS